MTMNNVNFHTNCASDAVLLALGRAFEAAYATGENDPIHDQVGAASDAIEAATAPAEALARAVVGMEVHTDDGSAVWVRAADFLGEPRRRGWGCDDWWARREHGGRATIVFVNLDGGALG